MEYGTSKVLKRAHLILEIAARMAEQGQKEVSRKGPYSFALSNRLEEITLHVDGYAEPGYSPGSSGFVATGNWNDVQLLKLPERISALFQKMGIECEWSDEWTTCDECSKLIRTQPDSHYWTPAYVESKVESGICLCKNCAKEEDN